MGPLEHFEGLVYHTPLYVCMYVLYCSFYIYVCLNE